MVLSLVTKRVVVSSRTPPPVEVTFNEKAGPHTFTS